MHSVSKPDNRAARELITTQIVKLRARDRISPEEEEALASKCSETRRYEAGEKIVRAREPLSNSNLLVEGMVARQIYLPDGGRQIVGLHVPGDFVDLHSFLLHALEHEIICITAATIAVFPHAMLNEIVETQPHLTRMLWLSTLIDAAIHREWEVNLGRRRARDRLAHLFCELHARLDLVGRVSGNVFSLPLTQIDLADCCGLTSVHVNRMLRELREDGLVEFRSGTVTILDVERLAASCDFDPFYLNVRLEPR